MKPSPVPWFRSFLGHDPLPALRQLKTPALALLAELDHHAPAAAQEPLLEGAWSTHPDALIQILPGHNHLFQQAETGLPEEYARIEETFSEEALGTILHWLEERLLESP